MDEKLDLPPPFLKGAYLRDDFDFEKRETAIPPEPVEPEFAEPQTPDDDPLFMSDDDFIKSLTTLSDSEEPKPEPLPAPEPEPATSLLPLDPVSYTHLTLPTILLV